MTDRSVTVRLGVDNTSARRATAQSEQDFRRVAQAATASAAEQQNAFQRASTAEQASFERTAAVARTTGRATQEAMAATTVSVGRLAAAAEEVPATFASAASLSTRAMAEIATSAQTTSTTVVAAETRMSEATAASAAGIRNSLAMRLAAAEAVVAQEAALATATTASAAAGTSQAAALGNVAATGGRTEKAFSAVRTSGLLMLGMFAAAVVTAAKFEKAMSGVEAVADATEQQMGRLREAALIAGRDTAYSASQAASAEAELAKAGVSVDDILSGALKGSLALAAAGQLDLAESATISAQAMNTFKLRGSDVSHIADVLAAGANKSAADVHGLGESLRMGGLLAQQTGLSLEDTVGVLSAFADRALIGSDAGTSLKTMLQRLVPQSDEAKGIMDQLGFSAYDAGGSFVGLTKLAGNLKSSFSNLTPEARNAAMATIFGSDSVRAATILYELGSAGVDRYRNAVNDQGAATRMAGTQMNNLAGDIEQLSGSLEVALINGGTAATGVLRDMVQWVTHLVNAWSSLPSWLQTSTIALFGIGGALALLAGGIGLILPKVVAFQASLATLAETMPVLAGAAGRFTGFMLGPWGIALGVASAALAVFGLSTVDVKQEVQGLTEAVKADSNAIGANVRAWLAHKLETDGVLKAAKALGISTADVTDAILGNSDAVSRVNGVLETYLRQVDGVEGAATDAGHGEAEWTKSLRSVEGAMKGLSPEITGAVEAAKREAEAAGGASSATKGLGDASRVTAQDLSDTRSAVEKLTDSLDTLNGKNISATKASIAMQSSLADLRDKVKENGLELDIHTAKGRDNKSALLDAASAAQAHAKAVMEQTGSSEQAIAVFGEDVEALKRVMSQAGWTQQQIESLTSAYAKVPPAVTTKVSDPGALQTIADLQEVKAKVMDVPPGKSITIRAPSTEAIQDLRAVGYTVDQLPGGKDVKITVPSGDAVNGTARIQQAINNIQGRTVTVSVGYDREYADRHQPVGWANGGIRRYAAGGITAFASGSERHVAQIAPAGAMRLWAEPETGGEAYIPLAGAKRGRSLRILDQVAGMFGQQLIPARPTAGELIPARQLASPVAAAAAGGGGPTTNITLYGARQGIEEQLADIVRHQQFIT
ncbi:phage tail tape measure protein [Kitasatospora sp. NPDC127116]|uniref:phage tail tape measure protein n=1 Tax=Kitasatospora sp. NPDC127116 TaxID=3345367 RepID=UPI00363FD752